MRDSRARRRELDDMVQALSLCMGIELRADFNTYGGWVLVASDNSKPFGARRRTREALTDAINFTLDAYRVKEHGHA